MVIKMGQGTLKKPRARTEIQFSIINMPHSERRRTGITKHRNKLNEAIKRLKSSSSNYNENAQVITVSTTLGELILLKPSFILIIPSFFNIHDLYYIIFLGYIQFIMCHMTLIQISS